VSVDDRSTRNVIVTGFMGTGKSTVGRLLADRLGFDFVDTDAMVEERHGPIPTIFTERGEPAFRAMEREVAAELSARSSLVIATGGGLMLDADNAAALGRAGRVFCLIADTDEILRRVITDSSRVDRPLLASPDPRTRIVELLAERATGYAEFDHVDTDGRTPDEVAAEIERRLDHSSVA
jgi:shikimate kinase